MVSLLVLTGFFIVFYDSLWVFMVLYGSSCFFMVLHVSSWFFMIIPGSLLFFLVFFSCQWFSTVWFLLVFSLRMLTMLPGFSCFVVVLYVLHGSFLFFVVLHGSSCFFRFLSEFRPLFGSSCFCIVLFFVWFLMFFFPWFSRFVSLWFPSWYVFFVVLVVLCGKYHCMLGHGNILAWRLFFMLT